jgi:hypothetical protein
VNNLSTLIDLLKAAQGAIKLSTGDEAHNYIQAVIDELQHSCTVSDNLVDCGCGDSYPSQSYGAGFIHAIGNCPNCEAAKSAAQEQQ